MIINIKKRYACVIIFLMVLGIGIFVVNALAPGVAPDPGHLITQVAPPAGCGSGQVLKWGGSSWSCVALPSGGSSVWSQTGTKIYYNSGNVGIGTTAPQSDLHVAGLAKIDKIHVHEDAVVSGNIIVSGSIKNEANQKAFFVNVLSDDCGWYHPYLGCPSGYVWAGQWHTGHGVCDGNTEGVGNFNGEIDSGWMVFCVAQ